VYICVQLTDSLKIARGGWKQNFNDLTIEDIQQIVGYFRQAAIRSREAGFDAIEIHAAHGYTLSSSLSLRNKRGDEYGGNMNGRMKMVTEVYQTVRDALGPDYPIGIRINGEEFIIDGNTLQQSRIIARKCAEMGFDYISISAGGKYEDSLGLIPKYELPANYPPFGGYSGFRAMPPAWMPEAVNVYLAADIRETVRKAGYSTPIITAGRIPNPKIAEVILRNEQADIIALSRPLLRDPDWPRKAREGRDKEINLCTYCNYCIERELYDEAGFCQYLNE
jgi:2,4-dienoyl-CoA reductase-like NADH-dependent reductase (Old Yellow Enzyme family)